MKKRKGTVAATSASRWYIGGEEWRRVVHAMCLSPREADILAKILRGCTDKQIAAELGISGNTVRTHLRHIFLRHALCGRMELAIHVFALLHRGPSPK